MAEEARKLAEGSQHAAVEISSLISAIQTETAHAAGVVEEGTERTQKSATVIEQTHEAFQHITTIAGASAQITASAQTM